MVVPEVIDEGVEEGLVKGIALGVVLDGEAEGIIAEPGLLDDVVVRAAGLDFQAGADLVEGLVVRAVDGANLQRGAVEIAEGLDVLELEVVVVRDVEMKRASEGDVEDLKAAADGEERQALFERARDDGEFPGVAGEVGFLDQAGIRHGLTQVFTGDIKAAGEEQAVDALGNDAGAGVPEADIGVGAKDPLKEGLVAVADPCGNLFQLATVTRKQVCAYYLVSRHAERGRFDLKEKGDPSEKSVPDGRANRPDLGLAEAHHHVFLDRIDFAGRDIFSIDQSQNLRSHGPLPIDKSGAMRIGLRQIHLFTREGLEFQHFGFCQIPNPLKCGIRVHTQIDAFFRDIQPRW